MNIGEFTFQEYKKKAADFHGYPAPGILVGGYMVEMAKAQIPEGTLFEAVVETGKCLPDAVQLLTLCSSGNGWMKVVNLGRYALSLFDKYTGEGVRVYVDSEKLEKWPETAAWFMKRKPKAEQDTEKLFAEIEEAGDQILSMHPITIAKKYLGHAHKMGDIGVCPVCTEAYPVNDGGICRGCQGEAPYVSRQPVSCEDGPELRATPVSEAVGQEVLHDMTGIEPGVEKGPVVEAGDVLGAGDVCRLQRAGKHNVYTEPPKGDWVHENDAVKAFAERMAGENIVYDVDPHEGKIDFQAEVKGVLSIDLDTLERFNLSPDVMLATRHDGDIIPEGKNLAGTRAIPLYISQESFSRALTALGDEPLLNVTPMRQAKVGVLVTGTEVFQGLIEDKFIPIVTTKVANLGSEVVKSVIAPDDKNAIMEGVEQLLDAGVDMIVTTAGMSVDPDDVTRPALVESGLVNAIYGMPVLPGAMSLVGELMSKGRKAQVVGVPACALFFKTTAFDLLLPRLLAGHTYTRKDIARLAEGGFCMTCKVCTFPKCPFGK